MGLGLLMNGLEDDPFVYIEQDGIRPAVLFDCGFRSRGHYRRLRKVEILCVTHGHIDHLIGFDHLVRSLLNEGRNLLIFGPPGIRAKIGGKLAAYDWDRSADQDLTLVVHEVATNQIRRSRFVCFNRFREESLEDLPNLAGCIHRTAGFSLHAAPMSHGGAPCLAYSYRADGRWKIRKQALQARGLTDGPWVRTYLEWLDDNRAPDHIMWQGKDIRFADIREQTAYYRPGIIVTYITDTLFTNDTYLAAIELARASRLLICEATFLDKDCEQAAAFSHLTAHQAGLIAKGAEVRKLLLNHPSKRYHGAYRELLAETRTIFPRTQLLGYKVSYRSLSPIEPTETHPVNPA